MELLFILYKHLVYLLNCKAANNQPKIVSEYDQEIPQSNRNITKTHCHAMAIVITIRPNWLRNPKWSYYSSYINIWYIY